MRRLVRHWFLAGLAIVVAAAAAFPEAGNALRGTGALLPSLVASTLFILGLSLDVSRARGRGVRLAGVVVGLASTYAVAPACGYALSRALGPPLLGPGSDGHFFLEAVMLAATQAGTLASAPALVVIARGDQALALVLTLASNLLTVFVTPFLLELSLGILVSFPAAEMTQRMALVILLPVVAGQLVRLATGGRLEPWMSPVRVLPQITILVFVFIGFSSAGLRLAAEPLVAVRFLVVCFGLHLALLAWTYGASSWLALSAPERASVVLCGAQKTLPNGIYLWDRFFAANPHGGFALVQYHVLQLVLDSLLAPFLNRGSVNDRPATDGEDLTGHGA